MIKIKDLLQKHKEKRFIDVSEQDFTVRLRPILGIQPALYLSIFSLILLFILFFFLFFFPGIKRNGSIVLCTSSPPFSALYVDGNYRGETPLTLFVPKGNHTFEIRYTGSKSNPITQKIEGRLFGSLFFPKKESLFLETTTIDPLAKAKASLSRFFQLSCYHTFETGTLPPPLLTKAVHAILKGEEKRSIKEALDSLFFPAFLVANTPELKKDLFQAFLLVAPFYAESDSRPSYQTVANQLLQWSKEYPYLYFEYYSYFTPEQRKEIRKEALFQEYKEGLVHYLSYPSSPQLGTPTGRKRVLNGIEFKEYRGGIGRLSEKWTQEALKKIIEDQRPSHIPLLYQLSPFWIATQPINGNQFQTYLKKHPQQPQQWRSQNQINRYYAPPLGKEPVVAISHFAASDYLKSYGWRLPSILELARCDLSKELTKENSALKQISFQEWTQDSYGNSYLLFYEPLPEKAVFLHGKHNENGQPQFTSFPSEFCTEATGFRPAFSEKPIQMLPLSFDFSKAYYKVN